GAGNDTFQVLPGGIVSGSVDGQGGSDTLDYSLFGTAVQVTLSTVAAAGSSGTAPGTGAGFSNVESVAGRSGSDPLVGPAADSLFNVTGSNSGNLTSAPTFTFSSFENLTGGPGNDLFTIANGAGISGVLSADGGVNTLSYAGWTTAVTVNLA